MQYRVDGSWHRTNDVVMAGSPLTMFRLSKAGGEVVDQIVAGEEVASSSLIDRLLDAGAIHPAVGAPTAHAVADLTIVTPQFGGIVRFRNRVVVDDGSVPPLDGASSRLPVNRGPSAARNEGRRQTHTSLVAFVDADVDLPIDRAGDIEAAAWWAPLLAHFDDPTVGAVAPRVIGDAASSLDLGAKPARIRQGTRVSYVPAAALIVRAEAFDSIGGFDETLRFGEDVDLVWRLDQAGWRCRYEPRATVVHQRRNTLPERLRQQFGYGSSSAPLALRHPGALAPFRSDGWTAASWLLLGRGHPIVAIGIAGSRAIALFSKLPDVPRPVLLKLSAANQVVAARQLTAACRRAWWPLLAVACLVSRRARRIVVLACVAAPQRIATDVAFGAGLWATMFRLREWQPIIPKITRQPVGQRRR